jgi:serine/threonine-protein kinase
MFPQIFGKYVLEREIAAGGMARVYLATLRGAVGFEKRLVVKQIRPELAVDDAFVKRFVDEANTWSRRSNYCEEQTWFFRNGETSLYWSIR